MQFMRQEAKEGRDVMADWAWIVPKLQDLPQKYFTQKCITQF